MNARKTLVLLSAVLMLAGSCEKKPAKEAGEGEPPPVREEPKHKAASLLPERVILAYVCNDAEKLQEAARQSAMQKLIEDEEIKGFVSKIQDAIQRAQAGTDAPKIPEDLQKRMEELPRGEVALALLDVRAGGAEPEIDIVGYIGVKSVESARELIDELIKLIPEEVSREKYVEGAVEIEAISADPFTVCWAYVGSRVVVALGKGCMRRALGRIKGAAGASLADNARFKEAIAKVDAEAAVMYVDAVTTIETIVREIRTSGAPVDVPPKVEAALDTLGLNGVEAVAYSMGYSGAAIEEKLFAAAAEPRKGLPGLLVPGNLGDAIKKLVPQESHSVTAARARLSGLLPLLRSVVAAVEPGQVEQFDQGLGMAGQQLGINFEKDVSDALGEEILFIGGPLAGAGPFGVLTRNAIAIRVKDSAAFSRAYGAAIGVLAMQLASGGEGAPGLVTFAYEGYTCNAVSIPLPVVSMISPTACLTEDYLLVTADAAMMKQMLKVYAGKGPSLLEDPDFAGEVPEASADDSVCVRYVDWKETATAVLPLVQMGLSFVPAEAQQQLGLSGAIFPSVEAVTAHLFSEGGRGSAGAEGISYQGKSPIGGSFLTGAAGAGIVAGLTLPALARAREQARRAQCLSNLKQVGLACHMYAQDHNEEFPPHLGALHRRYVADRALFTCPTAGTGQSYVYVSGLRSTDPADWVVAYDVSGTHFGDGVNVLHVDGHVRWMNDIERIRARAREQIETLKAEGRQGRIAAPAGAARPPDDVGF